MADRFFPNLMPDFVAETPSPPPAPTDEEQIVAQGSEDSLLKLLSLPYPTLSERFKRTALDLKETVHLSLLSLYIYTHTTR